MEIDFTAAFDKANRQEILYNFRSVGIRGSVLFILTQFLSNILQHVILEDRWGKQVYVEPCVPQSSVLACYC